MDTNANGWNVLMSGSFDDTHRILTLVNNEVSRAIKKFRRDDTDWFQEMADRSWRALDCVAGLTNDYTKAFEQKRVIPKNSHIMLGLLRDKDIKARKPHECLLCGESILVGEPYRHRTAIEDGFIIMHIHPECERKTRDWDETEWETFSYGELPRPLAPDRKPVNT
jgi:hypothetical protein